MDKHVCHAQTQKLQKTGKLPRRKTLKKKFLCTNNKRN
jgi:hypothetical protein